MSKILTTSSSPVFVNTIFHDEKYAKERQRKSYFPKIEKLGVAEVSLGLICIILQLITMWVESISNNLTIYFGNILLSFSGTVVQGVCVGAWITITGGLGIKAGKRNSTDCIIKCHMAFSIIGSVYSAVVIVWWKMWAGIMLGSNNSSSGTGSGQIKYIITSEQTPGNQTVLTSMQPYSANPFPQGPQPIGVAHKSQTQDLFQPESQISHQQEQLQQPQHSINESDFQQTEDNQDNTLQTYDNVALNQSCSAKETASQTASN